MKLRAIFAFVGVLVAVGPGLLADDQLISLNSDYSYRMLDDTTEVNRKQILLLEERAKEKSPAGRLIFGMDMEVLADFQNSNTEAKFGYLMRHPTQNNQGGTSVSEMIVHDAKLQFTGLVNDWVTVYAEVLYDPQQSFGSGTNTDINRNQLSLRRGYVLLGDLTKSPVYGAVGKMATPFGLTDTVNPFSASTVWHAFGGLAYGGLVGYQGDRVRVSLMGIQGGAQFRATNSGDATPDDIANLAVDVTFEIPLGEEGATEIGASYVDGSAYCQSFPVVHFRSCEGFSNPAWDIHAKLEQGRWMVIAEYAQTTDEWPGTHNPNPPLDVFAASDVSSFDIGAKYSIPVERLARDLALSVDFSKFTSGPSGSPWESQAQVVVGAEMRWDSGVKMFAEYVHVDGYVPLNFVSGPDPFDPTKALGTTHSVAGATSDVFLVGLRAAI